MREILTTSLYSNEIVFFKANPSNPNHTVTTATPPGAKHPPSRRKEQRRNRSVPRSSDKVTQELLKLITEPIQPVAPASSPVIQPAAHNESSDDDQKRDNPVSDLLIELNILNN